MGNMPGLKAERYCVGNPKRRSVPDNMGRCLNWILILGMLAACSQKDMLQKFASPAEQAIARKYIDELRSLDFGEIEKTIDPTIAGEVAGGTLAKMAAMIPEGTPTSVQLVGANRFSSDSAGTTLNLTYEYQFGTQYLLMNVATRTKKVCLPLWGFGSCRNPRRSKCKINSTCLERAFCSMGCLRQQSRWQFSQSSCWSHVSEPK